MDLLDKICIILLFILALILAVGYSAEKHKEQQRQIESLQQQITENLTDNEDSLIILRNNHDVLLCYLRYDCGEEYELVRKGK